MPAERVSMRQIREVLRLRFASELPQRAIAKSLGLSQGAVSGYLSRARAAGEAGSEPSVPPSPRGVHQMRVASRRIRSALSAFKKTLPAAERRWASDELDRLDEILGPARNLDVFASDLLASRRTALPWEPALDRLATSVDSACQTAHAWVRELIVSPLYRPTALSIGSAIALDGMLSDMRRWRWGFPVLFPMSFANWPKRNCDHSGHRKNTLMRLGVGLGPFHTSPADPSCHLPAASPAAGSVR